MSEYGSLTRYVDAFNVLAEESRIRLCVLLRQRELCVTDLVRVTGMPQPRVSTHLGKLRDAGFVHDRRRGAQSFYSLAADQLPPTARMFLDEAASGSDPTLKSDRARLAELEDERRSGSPDTLVDAIERDYSPGRTWQSLALGIAQLLDLGDVLDVGSGDGSAASSLAPHCRSLTCIDTSARTIEVARARLAHHPHVRIQVADVHQLPFPDESFDAVVMFHTLTYAVDPPRAIAECARVLRRGGRLVLLCLDAHAQLEITARYGDQHPGFSPRVLRGLLRRAQLDVESCDVACRESRKPYLQVVLATANKPAKGKRREKTSR